VYGSAYHIRERYIHIQPTVLHESTFDQDEASSSLFFPLSFREYKVLPAWYESTVLGCSVSKYDAIKPLHPQSTPSSKQKIDSHSHNPSRNLDSPLIQYIQSPAGSTFPPRPHHPHLGAPAVSQIDAGGFSQFPTPNLQASQGANGRGSGCPVSLRPTFGVASVVVHLRRA
jgi:hypothetical protein